MLMYMTTGEVITFEEQLYIWEAVTFKNQPFSGSGYFQRSVIFRDRLFLKIGYFRGAVILGVAVIMYFQGSVIFGK